MAASKKPVVPQAKAVVEVPDKEPDNNDESLIKPTIWKETGAVAGICFGLFVLYSIINPPMSGNIGSSIGNFLNGNIGIASFTVPFVIIIAGAYFLLKFSKKNILFYPILTVALIWIIELIRCISSEFIPFIGEKGIWSGAIGDLLENAIGRVGSIAALIFITFLIVLLFTGKTFKDVLKELAEKTEKLGEKIRAVIENHKNKKAARAAAEKDKKEQKRKEEEQRKQDKEQSKMLLLQNRDSEPHDNPADKHFEKYCQKHEEQILNKFIPKDPKGGELYHESLL